MIEVISAHGTRLAGALAMWEAVRAVAKARSNDSSEALRLREARRVNSGTALVAIDEAATGHTIDVHQRYGEGTDHPARLNMGDCFAYVCPVPLPCKGDAFIHTDLG